LFDVREFYKTENDQIKDSYTESIIRIKKILENLNQKDEGTKKNYFKFLKSTGKLIIRLCKLEEELTEEYFNQPFDILYKENTALYEELLPDNYTTSYANPQYCVKILGEDFGQLFSWFYTLYRNYLTYAFYHKQFKMEEYNQLFIKVYEFIKNNDLDYEDLQDVITGVMREDRSREVYYQYKEQYDPDFLFYHKIVNNADLNDQRYLFRMGMYITDNEIKASRFTSEKLSDEEIKTLANQIVTAYYNGFIRDNKDVSCKSSIGFLPTVGLERLYREMIDRFDTHENKLSTSFLGYRSTRANEQYDNDHKFDIALFLDEEYKIQRIKDYTKGLEKTKAILDDYSGIMYIEKFGDPQFSPQPKKENLKLSKDQQSVYQEFNSEIMQLINSYIPRSKTSFCIVGFPTPKIGKHYEDIFKETVNINMLDSSKYESIQSKIIDTLDKADYVHVKGKGDNKTDFRLKMQPLDNPNSQTNFVNSGASVNIPCGEVFTAPQLKDTNGTLHVFETYQRGYRFDNLILEFRDGYTSDYSCTNFDSDEENKKYILENLFFPHESLPIGEFAIGTNTLAYKMARKFDIMNLLPVLILEKTGPHFAIGDTCFSRKEDSDMFNPISKKVICSKDNEKSLLRKTDPMEAYTNKHEDVVLPFDDIEYISAITNDGTQIDVIRNGRFVLTGTEELNAPLEE
jgi:aminopeptidase